MQIPARWLAVGFICIVVLATRATWFGDSTATYDEQLYSFIGWRMTQGDLPYVDWWDRKPFGLFTIYAAAHAIFGPEAIAYQIVAAYFALATALLTYRLARDLADRVTSTIAATLVTLLLLFYGSHSGQSEVFFIPLVLAMVWLVWDGDHPAFLRRSLWAMLIGGIALQVKYTVLPQCLFLGVYALGVHWRNQRDISGLIKIAGYFALLGLAPTILIGLFYAAIGEFDAFFFANFVSFFDRIPAPSGRFGSTRLALLIPLGLVAALGVYGALRMSPASDRARYWFVGGWCISALATVMLPATVYGYYYAALVPPIILLALPAYHRDGPLGLLPAVLLIFGAWFILGMPGRHDYSAHEQHKMQTLVSSIAPHVGDEGNCLFVYDGPTALYRQTGACAPSRYIYPDHLNNQLESNALGVTQEDEVARILATRPSVIVTAGRSVTVQNVAALGLVEAAIARDYKKRSTISIRERNITAWIRHTP